MAGYIGRAPLSEAIQSRVKYTASSGQTSFSFSYQPGYLDVYLDGVKIEDTTDYTATNGTTIVLTSGAIENQVLEAIGLTTFSLVNGKINYAASAAPTTGDDNADGYRIGSLWIDTTNDEAYRCVDDSTGAAVWIGTTLEATDLGSLATVTPTGTGSTSTFLRGDNAWVVPPDNDTVYTHPTTAGNKHVPTGGSSGQFLKYDSSGTAVWAADNDTVYTHPTGAGNKHVPTGGSTGQLLTNTASGTGTWQNAPVSLPTQSDPGTVDKYLQSDGSAASWAALDTDANTTTKGLYEHEHTIDANYSITSGSNALSAGPITISTGVSVTIPTGSTWVIA